MATEQSKDTSPSAFETQAVALAEQLGKIAGTIEGTAEQWLNRPGIAEQLTRVRDSATQLLESLAGGAAKGRKAVTQGATTMSEQVRSAADKAVSAASSAASSLGSVGSMGTAAAKRGRKQGKAAAKNPRAQSAKADMAHAPGKKHRKPAPTMHGAKKSDERIPKMRSAAAARQRRKSYA